MRKVALFGVLGGTLALALVLEGIYVEEPETLPRDRLIVNVGGDGVQVIPEEPPPLSRSVPAEEPAGRDRSPPRRRQLNRSPDPAGSSPRQEPRAAARTRTHRVESGQTLSEIAKLLLGDANRWREIQELNGIDDPRKVRAGQVLTIPAR